MLTQRQIAERMNRSMSLIRKLAMREDFPEAVRSGGPNGRLLFYRARDVDRYFRVRGRKRGGP